MEGKNWDLYAEEYHDCIISPFQKGVVNPIFETIKNIKNKSELVVADLGCGIGDFIPYLAKEFKKVYALDFSEEMLNIAKEKNKNFENVIYEKADMRDMNNLENSFDLVFTINSVLLPNPGDVKKAFYNINKTLKKNGKLIGIFPNMEAIAHYSMLVYEREFEKTKDEKKAIKNSNKAIESHKYDFFRGIFHDEDEKQKWYYKFELLSLIEESGFKLIKIDKVLYPWDKVGDYDSFEGKPKLWDWFIEAEKISNL